jgi:hypothetical protein
MPSMVEIRDVAWPLWALQRGIGRVIGWFGQKPTGPAVGAVRLARIGAGYAGTGGDDS